MPTPTSPPPAELLLESAADADRPPRRWPWVVGGVVVAVAAVAGLADGAVRDRQAAALAAATADARTAVDRADGVVLAAVEYASPLLTSASIPPQLRADLGAVVGDGAREGAAVVRAARDGVASVLVLPWHDDLAEARDAVLAQVDARAALLDEVAADPGQRALLVPPDWAGVQQALDALGQAGPAAT